MTAGYSATPQAKKLGLKPGLRLAFDHRPPGCSLAEAPDLPIVVGESDTADIIVSFFREAAELPERLSSLAARIHPAGAIWAAWPRRAGGHFSDITDNTVREHALPLGIVDVKVAAIDADWSGLRLVWRVENRRAKRPRSDP